MKPEFTIRFRHSQAELPAALWDACFPPSLEGRWWYQVLEASELADQFRFFYAEIALNGEPAGIAPVFLMNAPVDMVMPEAAAAVMRFLGRAWPALQYQRILFVGSPCSDEGTVGFACELDHTAAFSALQDALDTLAAEHKASLIIWKDFRDTDAAVLEHIAPQHGMFRLQSFPGTRLALVSSSKADYFTRLKGSRRHQVRKKMRQSRERANLTKEIVQFPAESVLEEVFGLFMQTYERSDTKFERLGMPFFRQIAAQPVSTFILLREAETGELVAFMLCFHGGDTVINKFIGFDYARPREWLLYFRLWEEALDWTLSQGARNLQSGQTGYAAKIEVGHDLVPLTNFVRHRNGLVNAVFRRVARHITWETLDDDLARHLAAHPEARPQ